MSKDSRKSTEWFDAQLRKAKDDFTELSKGSDDLSLIDFTMSGPIVKFGTKCPSMTST